jgi:hypothetical protein
MSLERKDIRAKLDPDMHRALTVIADAEHADIGEFIERELVRIIRDRVHAATVIAEETAGLGILGKQRELPGISGRGRK